MTDELLLRFTTVVEFLGHVLGPDYEVTLYDLNGEKSAVVAIANGRIHGQTVGDPLPEVVQELLMQKQYEQNDYILNFTSHLQEDGKAIRSSVMFLKNHAGKPVGLLGINFDDSRFLSLSNALLDLLHPRAFLRQQYPASPADASGVLQPLHTGTRSMEEETMHNNVSSMIEEIFSREARQVTVPLDRLTQDERIQFITRLNAHGLFRLKGAVQYTAEHLNCSQASIYRYLGKIKADCPSQIE